MRSSDVASGFLDIQSHQRDILSRTRGRLHVGANESNLERVFVMKTGGGNSGGCRLRGSWSWPRSSLRRTPSPPPTTLIRRDALWPLEGVHALRPSPPCFGGPGVGGRRRNAMVVVRSQ
eukprot:Tamp_20680.p1 GENE.Tamp_20680~~Tamp_20680.p1  ORF type:complete len:119 (+),score=0.50 Tamp_20680:554-910(+)